MWLPVLVLQSLAAGAFGKPSSNVAPPMFLDETNPFRANMARNISVNDPAVVKGLWERHQIDKTETKKRGPTILEYKLNITQAHTISKRAGEKTEPIINLKSCLFCEGKAKSTATVDMGDRKETYPFRFLFLLLPEFRLIIMTI